jgi:hypothetical protein
MRVRLIKKFAEKIDGIDLSAYVLGDFVDLTRAEARLLLAEGWAVPQREPVAAEDRRQYGSSASHPSDPRRALAADRPGSSRVAKRRLR